MTQRTFNGSTSASLANLDANFTELYELRNIIQTPGYTPASPDVFIDANGNLGVGTAAGVAHPSSRGIQLNTGGALLYGTSPGTSIASVFATNVALASDGTSQYVTTGGYATRYFQQSGGHFWAMAPTGTAGGTITWSAVMSLDTSGNLKPGSDNAQTLGASALRWSVVYAATGSINTSDAREKTAVTPMTASELAAAKALSAEIGTYQWLAAVQAKGADARTHVGLTVQRAIEIMMANGLDPMAYGFICHDAWPDQVDEQGVVTTAAGDRYAFRPDELLLFMARGFDARLTALGG